MPWSTLQGTAVADKLIGIDFMINDDDNNAARDAKVAWNSATDGAYANASLFGTGKLVNELLITGMDNFASENIVIFPNPSSNNVYVKGLSKGFVYEVFDNTGRIILYGQESEKIDISSLETGTYILKVKQGDVLKTVKISKM